MKKILSILVALILMLSTSVVFAAENVQAVPANGNEQITLANEAEQITPASESEQDTQKEEVSTAEPEELVEEPEISQPEKPQEEKKEEAAPSETQKPSTEKPAEEDSEEELNIPKDYKGTVWDYIYNSEYATEKEAIRLAGKQKKKISLKALDGSQSYASFNNSNESADDKKWRGGRVFTLPNYPAFIGTCCEPKVAAKTSGTATLTRIDNNSREAKAIYYFGYVWSGEMPCDGTYFSGGFASHLGESASWNGGLWMEGVCQRVHTGSDLIIQGTSSGNSRHEAIKQLFQLYETAFMACKVPDTFELYYGNAGSNQDFFVWNPNGEPASVDVSVSKKISNANATAGNGLYSVKGTTFALYKSAAEARSNSNPVAVFVIGANGTAEKQTVKPGTYYLVEVTAGPGLCIPAGLNASSGGTAVKIEKGSNYSL